MKKKIIIIVITLLVLAVGGYLLWDKVLDKKEPEKTEEKENKKEEKTETGKTTVDTENNILTFYKGEEKVGEYKCDVGDVEGYGIKCSYLKFSYVDNNYIDKVLILVVDGINSTYIDNYGGSHFLNSGIGTGTVILYDVSEQKEVEKYNNVYGVKHVFDGLFLIEYPDNTYKFITPNGLISRTYTKDELVFSCYEGCFIDSNYINRDNLLVFKKDGKYGVKKLKDDSIVINAEYEDIRFAKISDAGGRKELSYLIIKKDGLYNLYDLNNSKFITSTGYKKMFFINEKVLLVYKDNELSFKNLDETDYITDKIPVSNLIGFMPKINNDGIKIILNDNIAIITICEGEGKFEDITQYSLNLDDKTLTKKDKVEL